MKIQTLQAAVAAFALTSFALASSLSFAGGNGSESDSGVQGPAYEAIEAELAQLQAKYPQLAQKIVYGKTVQGRNLTLIRIRNSAAQPRPGAQAVIISGSIHGNEYLAVEDRLPRALLEGQATLPGFSRFIQNGGIVYIIPIFNPDGYAARQRENTHGVDLNRDFPVRLANHAGLTEVETQSFARYLDQDLARSNARLAFSLDYHCCIGALLYPWSFSPAPAIPQADLQAHQAIGTLMQRTLGSNYRYGTTPNLLGYSAVGTTKDYYYEKYHSLSFTFEGAYRNEPQNLPRHIQMWEGIFTKLTSAPAERVRR